MNAQVSTSLELTAPAPLPLNRLPRASYRLQLRSDFGFDRVSQLIDYLTALGISDLYLSPLFRAREESEHGYDVVDHSQIAPAFGSMDDLRRMACIARERDMGIVLDIVPNHMGINDPGNTWWDDVLENGPAARAANCFDIDWDPPGGGTQNQVLLPVLGQPFGQVLEAGELRVRYENSRFMLAYYDRRLPLAPRTWPPLLEAALAKLGEGFEGNDWVELQSVITQLRRLPPAELNDETSTDERYREQRVARRRLAALCERSAELRQAIDAALTEFNGDPADVRSFDSLEQLIQKQHYRLAFWRVAGDEINYRRFFDINDLAAIRVEDPQVYEAVHALTFELLREGLITGLRIDHPDGLLDPQDYFRHLQSSFRQLQSPGDDRPPLYVVAEKILTGEEPLPSDWPVAGTTGYDFLNQISAVLVSAEGVANLQSVYADLTDLEAKPRDIIYQGKQAILHGPMASELFVLASRLFRLARANRRSYDFTLPVLLRALREFIACFPVYRTYTRPQGWEVSAEDQGRIREAIRWAKRRNPTMPRSAFDYIASVLLLEFPPTLDAEQKQGWRSLAVRVQQVTGPVTAKGIEDTAFYRYFPLASLNEVGAELGATGIDTREFHRRMLHRRREWPAAMSASTTHDTKRGEDVRARLHVLSEMPGEYAARFGRWDDAVRPLTTDLDGVRVPEVNDRYLIHQTLLGTWPFGDQPQEVWEDYERRMHEYLLKAFREAKLNTSWLNPDEGYEAAMRDFVSGCLADRNSQPFRQLADVANQIAAAGFVNALSQVVLKATLPGVPDFFQGTEFWDFRLVDPDNRRPVDYEERTAALKDLQKRFGSDPSSLFAELTASWSDALKLLVTSRTLDARRSDHELWAWGDYLPLEVGGDRADHVVAFARRFEDRWAIVAVPRLPYGLGISGRGPGNDAPGKFTGEVWEGTWVELPTGAPSSWQNHLTGGKPSAKEGRLPLEQLFDRLSVAVLFPAAG